MKNTFAAALEGFRAPIIVSRRLSVAEGENPELSVNPPAPAPASLAAAAAAPPTRLPVQEVNQKPVQSESGRRQNPAPKMQHNYPLPAKKYETRQTSEPTLYNVGDPAVFGDKIGGFCAYVLLAVSWVVLILTFPLSLLFCLKVVKEYERAVMFRLGRLVAGGARGPGLFFVLPCVDTYRKVDLRVVSFNVPPQEILSKDSVTVSVDAVVYFRINNPIVSVTNVNDAAYSTKLLAQTTLRNVLGTKSLSDMLSEREAISHFMSSVLDEATEPWGVKVERVEVKDIRLPQQLMRAMAAEAEAARDARAKIIAAEGEQKASRALKEAAEVITQSPAALQLRYLQALSSIAAEHNSTIVFPLPIEMLTAFGPAAGANPCCRHHGTHSQSAQLSGTNGLNDNSGINDSTYVREPSPILNLTPQPISLEVEHP